MLRLRAPGWSLLALAAALAAAAPAAARDLAGLPPFLVDLSAQDAATVTSQANEALGAPIATVVDKPQPSPTGDSHDYVSYARYWWPNPATADHMPFIRKDGHANMEQVALGDEARLQAMNENVRRLALGWAVTRRQDYAVRADAWLRAWFIAPETAMHPNLDRGQVALGHDGNRGRGEGILDAHEFIGTMDALRMLHGSPGLSGPDEAAVQGWFRRYLDWLLNSPIGKAEHAAANNHGSWFLAQSIAIARYVGRDDVARSLAEEDRSRIASQFEANGDQPLELARADGLTYSAFNLSAQFLVVRLAAGLGTDLLHFPASNGTRLANAVKGLRPYNDAPQKWPGHQYRKMDPGFLNDVLEAEAALHMD
jgi:hypothetical protein